MWIPVSVQRQMCGDASNMSAHTYGYKVSGNICFIPSILVSKKKNKDMSRLDVLFILGLAANAEPDFGEVQNIRWSS